MTNPSVTTDRVLSEVLAERIRQDTKWGEQNHPDIDPRDIDVVTHHYAASKADIWKHVNEERATASRTVGRCSRCPEGLHAHTAWDGILLEEVWEALAESDPTKLRVELLQVAAVVVNWIETIDRRAAATDEKYPTLIGVYCDTCGTEVRGDYIVSDAMDKAARLEVARDYLRRNLSWSCTTVGDFCPKHVSHAAAEQPTACAKCTRPFDIDDDTFDGRAQYATTPYCRCCVDACHDSEIADHRCVICA